MLIPCQIKVITTAADIRQLYAIYIHRDIAGIVQYIGVTPLSELFALTDAHCNSEWPNVFGKPLTTLDIEVVALTASEREAYVEQRRLVAVHNPPCNKRGYWIEPKKQQVLCNETGETFDNATIAARTHGLSHSALINHLNRKPGHKSVKGRTYSRVVRTG